MRSTGVGGRDETRRLGLEELRGWSAYLAFFNVGSGTELRSLCLPSKYFTEPSPQPLPGFSQQSFP